MRHTCPDVALTELSYAALWTRPNFTAPSHRYSLRKLEDFKICVRNKFPQKKTKKNDDNVPSYITWMEVRWDWSTKSLYRSGPSQH